MPKNQATQSVISVVMPVFNGERFLREAIDSILTQTYMDFEFIIIDDGSTDCSPSIIASYAYQDSRIKPFRQENRGIVDSLNRGCHLARGKYIARMDADDVCAPTRLERQLVFLEGHTEVGIVGCGLYDNIDTVGAVLYTSCLPEDNDEIQRTLVEQWCLLHPSIMFRRSLFSLVGGYRKEFEGAEDHDFILRILEHSAAYNIPERLIRYRVNPRGLSVTYHQYMNELGEAAMRLARRRRCGQPEDLKSEVGHLAALKRRRSSHGGFAGLLQKGRDSLYAADRYYGFGCRELCAGRLDSARRCYLRSITTNMLFVKSWLGVMLSYMPLVSRKVTFLFKSSIQQYQLHSQRRAAALAGDSSVNRSTYVDLKPSV